ncbi:hypothetical protein BH11MYX4_BH11MYX4_32750 [soil metagenome]
MTTNGVQHAKARPGDLAAFVTLILASIDGEAPRP